MDEDEKIDRQSGGWKMSDHFTFSLDANNPTCKRSATAQVIIKPLPSHI